MIVFYISCILLEIFRFSNSINNANINVIDYTLSSLLILIYGINAGLWIANRMMERE